MSERRRLMMGGQRDTIALFHFDSSFNGNYVDSCGNRWTLEGNNTPDIISTHKFGTGSLRLQGSCALTFNTNLPFQDFTVEAWVYPVDTGKTTYSNWSPVLSIPGTTVFNTADIYNHYGQYYTKPNNVGNRYVYLSGGWNHVAYTYNSKTNKCCLYLNGVIKVNNETVVWSGAKGSTIIAGIGSKTSTTNPCTYVDEYRLSKGILYEGASFTPPSEPFSL